MNKKGFTMIEILIVIVVFGTGILGILTMLSNSIGYFDTVNMQTRATMLAKEALEIAYNHRDSNLLQGYPWNYVNYIEGNDNQEGKELFWEKNAIYKIWFTGEGRYFMEQGTKTPDFPSNFQTFAIELFTGGDEPYYYRYVSNKPSSDDTTDKKKGFARRVEFSAVKNEDWAPFDEKKILKIAAHALYQRGNTTGEVVLESFIWLKDSKVEE